MTGIDVLLIMGITFLAVIVAFVVLCLVLPEPLFQTYTPRGFTRGEVWQRPESGKKYRITNFEFNGSMWQVYGREIRGDK